jgi:hypothetical protein
MTVNASNWVLAVMAVMIFAWCVRREWFRIKHYSDVKHSSDVTVKNIKCIVCRGCGCVIDSIDGCSYGCKYDSDDIDERPPETMFVRVWERTDKLIEEREYVKRKDHPLATEGS